MRLAGYPIERRLEDGFFESILHPDDRDRVMEEQTAMSPRGDRIGSRPTTASPPPTGTRSGSATTAGSSRTRTAARRTCRVHARHHRGEGGGARGRRQKTYFEALVDVSPVAIVVMDRDEIVTAWNPAAERLFGYAATEAVGTHIDHLIFSEERRAEGEIT